MKVDWADLKNGNKHSLKDKKKHKDSVTVTVKLACDKDIVAAAEYSEILSEIKKSAYQEMSAFTSDFNHTSEDYVNYISTDLSAEMMSTQNDDQSSGR